jgi:hypothetical protein
MIKSLRHDLARLRQRAFDRADWAEDVLRRFHALDKISARQLQTLYDWMFVPPTLWPFNVQDVLAGCLLVFESGGRLDSRQKLLMEMLPSPPDEQVCVAAAQHEHDVASGIYEKLVKTPAKYAQNELAIKTDPNLQAHWLRIKSAFDISRHQDHKGLIRRSMNVERNLRPDFTVDMRREESAFQAVFDAFCLCWNLYGMMHDEPLPLKLTVNLTPHGTMIHIPAYWSFDPKRDLRWDAVARLHRIRVPKRQGKALAENYAQRMALARKLIQLDAEARQRKLKGGEKHSFLCAGLGLDLRTDPKRLNRLRAEFKNRTIK